MAPQGHRDTPGTEQTKPGMRPREQPYRNNLLRAGQNTKSSALGGSGAAAATQTSSTLRDEPGTIDRKSVV